MKKSLDASVGLVLTLNFAFIWIIPIAGMGMTWKYLGVRHMLLPIYEFLDSQKFIRKFAGNYIYMKEKHCDYFLPSVFLILSTFASLTTVFYWQLKYKELPWWLIAVYYCSWVGIGGRTMGAAYSLAHREGHSSWMYRKWIRQHIGNFFENVVGLFYGNVPWNFTTSHVFIHHATQGAMGDTFYLWDFDRTSLFDFLLYVARVFPHCTGSSSVEYFKATGRIEKAELLQQGQIIFVLVGLVILAVTQSLHFTWWIYIEPFLGMNFFLALINVGFHGNRNLRQFIDTTI